jgi:hypothetical protein
VRGILGELTKELARHVNVAELAGLETEYTKLIAKAGGIWSGLAEVGKAGKTPSDLLNKYHHIATAINLHVVLWVEDLERFSGADEILSFIFPTWKRNYYAGYHSGPFNKPQGIGTFQNQADYWQRLLSLPEIPDDEKDQLGTAPSAAAF